MFFRTPARKSIIALSLTLPLALVACGKGGDANKNAAATSAVVATSTAAKDGSKSATAAATTTVAASAAPASDPVAASVAPETVQQAPAAEQTPAQQPAPVNPVAQPAQPAKPVETLVNPLENGLPTPAPIAPIAGGKPADAAVQDSLTKLVGAIYTQPDLRSFIRYVPENTCKELLDKQSPELANIDYNQIPDIPIESQVKGYGSIKLESVKDALVNGNSASATIYVTTPEGSQSSTMRFRNDNGKWTFCDV